MHDAQPIDQGYVFAFHAHTDQQVQAGDTRRPAAGGDELDVAEFLADEAQPVEDRGSRDDRGTVLIVVEDGDTHALAATFLDDETLRRLDVLQIDRAEGRLQAGDDVDHLLRVGGVEFDIEHIDVGELLEQNRLAFHHRLRGERPDRAEPEHRGAIGDHGDQVLAGRQGGDFRGILGDRLARGGDTGRIGKRQIVLIAERLAGENGQLSRDRITVIVQRHLFQGIVRHAVPTPCLSETV